MAAMFVRLALGERIRIPKASDFAEGYYLVRSVDTLPAVIRGDQLFEGIEGEGDDGPTRPLRSVNRGRRAAKDSVGRFRHEGEFRALTSGARGLGRLSRDRRGQAQD